MERVIQQQQPDSYDSGKKGYDKSLWSSNHNTIDETCRERNDDKDVYQSVSGH
ncbi:hypothetical protein [Peribacillus sp. YIM B13482]|uniref:hypothetical protein n=1 Tax=Peribacillus sp. YIM B13482 TaxID=3366298 RepID=UPI00366F8F22